MLSVPNVSYFLDSARIESQRLEDEKAERTAKLSDQEESLAEAKARLDQDRQNLNYHAKDMAKAQDKIPSGINLSDTMLNKP